MPSVRVQHQRCTVCAVHCREFGFGLVSSLGLACFRTLGCSGLRVLGALESWGVVSNMLRLPRLNSFPTADIAPCVYIYIYIYIYIHTHIRDDQIELTTHTHTYVYMYVYIYIYMYPRKGSVPSRVIFGATVGETLKLTSTTSDALWHTFAREYDHSPLLLSA